MPEVPAVDVAEYILRHYGPMDAMKLQKLCYYVQAWSLAWGRGRMFPEKIEAWDDGPMIRELFARHKGQYMVSTVNGDPSAIDNDPHRSSTVNSVAEYYKTFSGQQLSDLTHVEAPWVETRAKAGVRPGERCDCEIPIELMQKYYTSLIQRARNSHLQTV